MDHLRVPYTTCIYIWDKWDFNTTTHLFYTSDTGICCHCCVIDLKDPYEMPLRPTFQHIQLQNLGKIFANNLRLTSDCLGKGNGHSQDPCVNAEYSMCSLQINQQTHEHINSLSTKCVVFKPTFDMVILSLKTVVSCIGTLRNRHIH